MRGIAAAALNAWLADGTRRPPQLLDVREPWELQISRIAGSLHIPMGQIPARAAELDAQCDVVVICHHGARSAHVATYLEQQGFARVHNLVGGVDAWARSVDPAMPVY
jgi:rhodanese-related sulfurtransferase